MNDLLMKSRDSGGSGVFASVDAQEVGWEHLNMAAMRLFAGQHYADSTRDCENAIVILGGRCHVRTSRGDFMNIGRRENVFSGMPWAVYLPPGVDFEIEATSEQVEFASCWVASQSQHPPKLVTPQDRPVEIRGGGNATRQINGILPPGFP